MPIAAHANRRTNATAAAVCAYRIPGIRLQQCVRALGVCLPGGSPDTQPTHGEMSGRTYEKTVCSIVFELVFSIPLLSESRK